MKGVVGAVDEHDVARLRLEALHRLRAPRAALHRAERFDGAEQAAVARQVGIVGREGDVDMDDEPTGLPGLGDDFAAGVEEALRVAGRRSTAKGITPVRVADVVLEVQRDQGFGHKRFRSSRRSSGWRNRSTQARPSRDARRGSWGPAIARSGRRPRPRCGALRRARRGPRCNAGRHRDISTPPTEPWPGTTMSGRISSTSVSTRAQFAASRSASSGGNHGKIGKMRSSARSPTNTTPASGTWTTWSPRVCARP